MWLSEAFRFVALCWACYWGYWHRLSPPLQTSSVWRRKGPWWLGHCEDRDLTVPSPEKAKQAKWLFHLVLCSCLYDHTASIHSPYCPSVLLWEVILQVPALWPVQRARSAFVWQLLYPTTPFSLALHHLSSAGHRAQPGTLALGSSCLLLRPRSSAHWVTHGWQCCRGCSAFLPIQILPMLPRGQAGSNHPGPFCNCTYTSVGCHTSGEQFLVTNPRKRGKNLDQRRK